MTLWTAVLEIITGLPTDELLDLNSFRIVSDLPLADAGVALAP